MNKHFNETAHSDIGLKNLAFSISDGERGMKKFGGGAEILGVWVRGALKVNR